MEKAKYRVYVGSIEKYICVTTTRNTEDMLSILLDNFKGYERLKIIKEVKGSLSVVIYGKYNSKVKQPRKVIDTVTGEIFDSAKDLATRTKKSYVAVRLCLTGNRKTIKNYKYLDQVNLLEL